MAARISIMLSIWERARNPADCLSPSKCRCPVLFSQMLPSRQNSAWVSFAPSPSGSHRWCAKPWTGLPCIHCAGGATPSLFAKWYGSWKMLESFTATHQGSLKCSKFSNLEKKKTLRHYLSGLLTLYFFQYFIFYKPAMKRQNIFFQTALMFDKMLGRNPSHHAFG